MTTRYQKRLDSLLAKLERDKQKAEENQPRWFREFYKNDMLPQGLHDGQCRCGRDYSPVMVHCPACGSTNHLGVSKLSTITSLPDGSRFWAQGYRCQRCQSAYTDMQQFLHCEAPPPQVPMRMIRREQKANETIKKAGFRNIDDFKKQLEDFRSGKSTDKKKVQ